MENSTNCKYHPFIPTPSPAPGIFKSQTFWYGLLVVVLGYFTYVHNYSNPPHLFWDENYHVASAQKYLNGTFFMEPHPPLGKLLIAAGEWLIDANPVDDQFLGTNHGKKLPPGFSFVGYRLFPVILAWLSGLLLYLTLLVLFKRPLWAALLTFPYLFDNALIVHNRSAMIDSPMIFCTIALLLIMVLMFKNYQRPKSLYWLSLLFGMVFGLIMTTKALGLITILFFGAVLLLLWPNKKQIIKASLTMLIGFGVVYVSIWQIHFSLSKTIEPELPDNGYFQASDELKSLIDAGKTHVPAYFPLQLKEHLSFLSHYSRGVPRLDLCKLDEGGSPFFLWPVGGRTISMRWQTPDGKLFKYLYLVPNAASWWLGLASVIIALGFLAASVTIDLKNPIKHRYLMAVLVATYLAYFVAISQLDRVMYLYHYFIPLVLSFVILGLVIFNLTHLGKWVLNDDNKTKLLLTLGILIFVSFQWFRPLTYYLPLTNQQFQAREMLDVWDMKCAKCKREGFITVPNK